MTFFIITFALLAAVTHGHVPKAPGDPLPDLLDPNLVPKFVSELYRVPTLARTPLEVGDQTVDYVLRAR